ncbi:MAG: pilus assembly protein PilM [Clostridia bacterium]|nr:pilus assembly protein PilM [Clostridia bacterium]
MQKREVAVIDVGSSKITAIIGERGTNKTFLIKGRYSYEYDGFDDGVFFDVDKLQRVLTSLSADIKKASRGSVNTVYVGVPGEFTRVFVKDSQISFPKKKKIQEEDVDSLFESAFVMSSNKYTLINRSAVVYELDDFRRLANPVGSSSQILKGRLSFILCSNYFIEAVKPVLENAGIKQVECVSSALAEALYLVDAETRDRIALIADVGFITTTLTIIQGDGILYQKAFPYGGGYITAEITEKFNVDFAVAEKLKRKINLSRVLTGAYDLVDGENGDYYPIDEIQKAVKQSLDNLCENISNAIDSSGFSVPEYVPLMITGGGIAYIRGAKEHLSGRLGSAVEIIAPKMPLMDKPTESNLLSLMELALEQR